MKKSLLIPVLFFFFSCNDQEVIPSSGNADFREYIAVGNSLTAGYSDGGLYRAAQLNSYPAILANQFKLNSGLTFVQPLMPEGNGSGYIELLSYPQDGFPVIRYLDEDARAFDKVEGPFHNLGVPGIRVKDILMTDYGTVKNNEFFFRMLEPGTENNTAYLDLIADSNHSFFTCWIGNNDVLGFANEGGFYGEEGYGPYGRSGLTDLSEFESNYLQLITQLTKNDAKGVLITIPDILHIPYFNLVTNDNFPNLSTTQVNALNIRYEEFNSLIDTYNETIANDDELTDNEKERLYREKISFSSSNNAFVIEDKDLPDVGMTDSKGKPVPRIRHLADGDKITIPGILEITDFQKLAGINNPLGDRFVLTGKEISLIEQYRKQYNEIIKNAALNNDLALFDIDVLLNEFKNGKTVDGVFVSTEIIEGGLFSLDGTHLTQRGYALIANEIIKKINQKYHAEIPGVNISGYKAVDIP